MLGCYFRVKIRANGRRYLRRMNRLRSAASRYLLQHAHQPVHWNEFGYEALDRAAAEGKWLLVSVGYSTCHWCHVMAREVFEDPDVAEVLNNHFVSIKVDREERPDLDQAYMAASLAMTGQGGWPLNAVCLPDGRPVWTCTYLPKDRFVNALRELQALRTTDSLRAEDYAERVRAALNTSRTPPEAAAWDADTARAAIPEAWDGFWGGFRGAPKFPLTGTWSALRRWSLLRPWPQADAHLTRTIETLSRSGTYDLLRGGLFRYSTDGAWVVPHFEKMLYDSAQLASWCAAHGGTSADRMLAETLEFMERDLLRPDGLFAAALDADHPEGEGRDYIWSDAELDAALGSEAPMWRGILERESRRHEGHWVLAFGPAGNPDPRGFPGFAALREAGLRRPLAKRDDKCVLAWNALAVTAFADGAQRSGTASDRARLMRLAEAHRRSFADGAVHVHYPDGRTQGPAFLDDLVFSTHMALRCAQVLLDPAWLDVAEDWFVRSRETFERPDGMYCTAEPDQVFAAPLAWDDDVLPNVLALWAECALILGHLRGQPSWVAWAESLIDQGLRWAASAPARHTSWLALAELTGPQTTHWLIAPHAELGPRPLPASPLWGPMAEPEASVYAQLCRMDACTLVVRTNTDFERGPNPFTPLH